jgi:hypothetical protein
MRRVIVAALVSCLAAANVGALHAQAVPQSDTTQAAAAAGSADSLPVIVRVSSRKLPFMPGDLLMMNCTFSGDAGFTIFPWACVRQARGTLARLDADSVAFVRDGRTIRLAARDVKKLERLTGRSALRTAGSAVMSGLTGVAGAAMIGIGGGFKDDRAFVVSAVALGAAGAIVGAVRGGSTWKEVPRTFEVAPAQR